MPESFLTDPDFRADFPKRFKEVLRGGLSVAEAAKRLGVRRQMYYAYLSGAKGPSRRVLGAAHREWGLWFKFRGHEFPGSAFDRPEKAVREKALQLKLFGAPEGSKDRVLLKIGSGSSKVPELSIEIRFHSA